MHLTFMLQPDEEYDAGLSYEEAPAPPVRAAGPAPPAPRPAVPRPAAPRPGPPALAVASAQNLRKYSRVAVSARFASLIVA